MITARSNRPTAVLLCRVHRKTLCRDYRHETPHTLELQTDHNDTKEGVMDDHIAADFHRTTEEFVYQFSLFNLCQTCDGLDLSPEEFGFVRPYEGATLAELLIGTEDGGELLFSLAAMMERAERSKITPKDAIFLLLDDEENVGEFTLVCSTQNAIDAMRGDS